MRKTLLTTLMAVASLGVIAQQAVPQPKPSVANKSIKYKLYSKASDAFGAEAQGLSKEDNNSNRATTTTVLGSSTYALQTNASIATRITNNSDGTRSMTWTWSNTAGFADRGTGYVYFNGTSNSAAPTARIESVRTGWPNIGVLGDNSEVVVSHMSSTSPYGLMFAKRSVKGTGAWTENTTSLTCTASQHGNIWGRMAVGGSNDQTLHVISISYPNDPVVTTTPVFYKGQQGAILYSRSQDGGATWDIQHQVNTAHDSTQYYGFDGDGYAIDAKGTTVAYVSGSFTTDLFLMKSIDNGNTWTKTVLLPFPIPMCNDDLTDINGDNVIDTVNTTDGSVAVLIDNAGMCHVWAGAMRVMDDDSTDGSISYFPGTNGLLYWNESMGASAPVTITGALDYDLNGVLDLPAPPSGFPFGVYQVSLSGQPHAGINAAGEIYLSYAAVVENTDINSKAVRNVYAMMTDDGGATWSPASRIAADDFAEQVFASVARKVDGCMHYIYQQDAAPGHGIGSGNQDAADNTGVLNELYYACVVPSEVANGNISVNEVSVDMINNILVYPNPAEDMITVEIGLINNVKANIRLVSVTGQQVMSEQVQLIEGNNFMKLDLSGLAKGVYMLNVGAGSLSKTQRVVVK
jgi:hypothetical protein